MPPVLSTVSASQPPLTTATHAPYRAGWLLPAGLLLVLLALGRWSQPPVKLVPVAASQVLLPLSKPTAARAALGTSAQRLPAAAPIATL